MKTYRKLVILGGGSMLFTPEKVGMLAVSQACREAEGVIREGHLDERGVAPLASPHATLVNRRLQPGPSLATICFSDRQHHKGQPL